MTPKMLNALREAAAADRTGGLHRTNAGWRAAEERLHHHHFATVNALIACGYLQEFGGAKGVSRYACISNSGASMLELAGFERDGSPSKGGSA